MYEGYTGDKEDKQAIFDFIVEKARKQRKKSIKDNQCVYRGSDGSMCFIGFLIPDYKYTPRMDICEGLYFVLETIGFSHLHPIQFFRKLRQIHDHEDPTHWERRFEDFAKCFNLIYTSPETSNV